MESTLTWKTKFFSNTWDIIQYDRSVGEIVNKAFSRSASGTLRGKKLLFEIRGFFKQQTRILEAESESVVAEVAISSWKTKATISYNNHDYTWQHDNFWNTKWSISDVNGALVKYHSRAMGGEITAYTSDEVLIIAGLFIKNYFRQRAAAAAAST
ncbi:MAG: hypothetical protein MUE74_06255 [Bacteroidales bacterium]|jgi:hypothetical protein|nr:hypothetical protein [Bacteroidales bacterium]